MIRALHPHQAEALTALRRSLGSGKRRPMLQAPTGSGKTLTAAAVVDGALAKGKRVIFTVPALELIEQTARAFWNEGIRNIGIIQADHPDLDWSRPVQVASVQTLMRRRSLPPADVVILDEVHRWFRFYGEWMAWPEWQNVPFIGLSATPWTRGLGKHFDDLIVAATTRSLIDQGYLSDFRVLAPSHPDLTGVRVLAGDYHDGELSEAMNKPHLIGEVVEVWKRKGENRSTLCFAVDRAHGKHLQRQFEAAGVPAGYIDGETPADERKRIREQFHDGSLRIVVNVMCLTAGVDWDVRCIILARPTRSEMLFVQIIGRGLRTAEGKDHCLILDHSDTHLRLGFVTDIHHDRLDDGRPRTAKKQGVKPEALPKECPACSFLKPAKAPVCPSCGFKPERQSEVRAEAGELSEITGNLVGLKAASRQEKQIWYSGLLRIAQERGYQQGWVSHTYKQKFGVWPRDLIAVPAEPSPEVRGYVKFLMIRRAKSRSRAA